MSQGQVDTRVYDFRLTLAGPNELTPAVTDAFFEAGCEDASVWSEGPTIYIDFHRDADSLGNAIGSAIGDVESAGFAVARVDVEQPAVAGR